MQKKVIVMSATLMVKGDHIVGWDWLSGFGGIEWLDAVVKRN
jgi:hypothetical protein